MTTLTNVSGTRFFNGEKVWTLVDTRFDYDTFTLNGYRSSDASHYTIFTFRDDDGNTCNYTGAAVHQMTQFLIYHPESAFELGDSFEIKREGLDPNLRGRLVEVNPDAAMYPYKIQGSDGNEAWFAYCELTKIHSITSRERAPQALEILREQIKTKKAELEALEIALEVLEYASN